MVVQAATGINRIRYHFRGNAEGSTLRLTLGCLLIKPLGIELRRVGSGKRRHDRALRLAGNTQVRVIAR